MPLSLISNLKVDSPHLCFKMIFLLLLSDVLFPPCRFSFVNQSIAVIHSYNLDLIIHLQNGLKCQEVKYMKVRNEYLHISLGQLVINVTSMGNVPWASSHEMGYYSLPICYYQGKLVWSVCLLLTN